MCDAIRMDFDLTAAMCDIESTPDLLERALKLSGVVSSLFARAGWPLMVVGGSAVEFYTEGAYMSGDIDFCRRRLEPIPLRLAQELMGSLGAAGGPRSWKVGGLFVDLLGLLENESRSPAREVETPYGTVSLMPPELLLVERVLSATYPERNAALYDVAKKIAAAGLSSGSAFDWDEALRLAALPSFRVLGEVEALRREVQNDLR
jgi:hypothetical protein